MKKGTKRELIGIDVRFQGGRDRFVVQRMGRKRWEGLSPVTKKRFAAKAVKQKWPEAHVLRVRLSEKSWWQIDDPDIFVDATWSKNKEHSTAED